MAGGAQAALSDCSEPARGAGPPSSWNRPYSNRSLRSIRFEACGCEKPRAMRSFSMSEGSRVQKSLHRLLISSSWMGGYGACREPAADGIAVRMNCCVTLLSAVQESKLVVNPETVRGGVEPCAFVTAAGEQARSSCQTREGRLTGF